jgi:AraC-like DNA-binding protein
MKPKKAFFNLGKNYSFFTTNIPIGSYFTNSHFHDCFEVGLCITGAGEFRFSKKSYKVNPGDIFIVNNMEPHVCRSDENNPVEFIFLFFSPAIVEEFDIELLMSFIYNPVTFTNKISSDSKTASNIGSLIINIHEQLNEKDISYDSLVKILILQMCVVIRRHYRPVISNVKSKNYLYKHDRIRTAVEYINNNIDKEIKLVHLSEILYISESRVRHFFKETMGIGFKDYLILARIENAKRLLANPEEKPSDIYMKCGFQSSAYFYKVFKDATGYSPNEYIQIANQSADTHAFTSA